MPSSSHSSSISRLLALFLLCGCCLLASAAFLAVERVPQIAASDFGPAGPDLNRTQRFNYSLQLLFYRTELLEPIDPAAQPQNFDVSLGETASSLAVRLEEAGLIRSAQAMRLYMIYAGLDTGVQAGEYQVSGAMNTVQMAHLLQDATPTEVTFHILAGWRSEEIAESLPSSGLNISPDDFLRAVRSPSAEVLPAGWPQDGGLDGYLFPDAYRIRRNASLNELLSLVLQRFDQNISADMRQAFDRQGLTVDEAVILASLVQREAMVTEEQPLIASVFYNRLAVGMKLDSDPTVQYALGYNAQQKTWWTNPLSLDDLKVNSPYNTYMNGGLPPGPISNPGLSALQAVAYPAQSPYYFFRARCDGSGYHNFSTTFEEHLQKGCP